VSALEHAGAVGAEYLHVPKIARPQSSLTLRSTVLKWYEIAPADAPVPLVVRALARRSLRDATKSGSLRLSGDFGFVILHRCGEDFYFLLVSTWQNDNELWETVLAKDGAEALSFRPWQVEGTHRPTFCVWELGAVCHERTAWSEYLRSPRDEAARRAYLASTYEGEV
jgi:hypothetical protein